MRSSPSGSRPQSLGQRQGVEIAVPGKNAMLSQVFGHFAGRQPVMTHGHGRHCAGAVDRQIECPTRARAAAAPSRPAGRAVPIGFHTPRWRTSPQPDADAACRPAWLNSARYSIAASDPAMASWLWVPVIQRFGRVRLGRPQLVRAELLEMLAAPPQQSQVRTEELVSRARQVIAVPADYVDQPVRRVMHCVDKQLGPGRMRPFGNLPHRD